MNKNGEIAGMLVLMAMCLVLALIAVAVLTGDSSASMMPPVPTLGGLP